MTRGRRTGKRWRAGAVLAPQARAAAPHRSSSSAPRPPRRAVGLIPSPVPRDLRMRRLALAGVVVAVGCAVRPSGGVMG